MSSGYLETRPTVLIFLPNDGLRLEYQQAINRFDCNVLTAATNDEALKLCTDYTVDILIFTWSATSPKLEMGLINVWRAHGGEFTICTVEPAEGEKRDAFVRRVQKLHVHHNISNTFTAPCVETEVIVSRVAFYLPLVDRRELAARLDRKAKELDEREQRLAEREKLLDLKRGLVPIVVVGLLGVAGVASPDLRAKIMWLIDNLIR